MNEKKICQKFVVKVTHTQEGKQQNGKHDWKCTISATAHVISFHSESHDDAHEKSGVKLLTLKKNKKGVIAGTRRTSGWEIHGF